MSLYHGPGPDKYAGWNGGHFSAIKSSRQPEISAYVSPYPRLARASRNVQGGA